MLVTSKKAKVVLRVIAMMLLAVYLCSVCTLVITAVPLAVNDYVTEYVEEAHNGYAYKQEEELIKVDKPIEEEIPPKKALLHTPILFNNMEYEIFYDIELSTNYISELDNCATILGDAINSYEYSNEATVAMEAELARICDIAAAVKNDITIYEVWEQEHYYAAKTYEFLRKNGYSAEVACAIIGNMMIETSGGTLDLKPTIYSPGGDFYGLCQWSLYYRPGVANMSFEDQLVYLHNDLSEEFDTFGFCYKRGFTLENFLAMTDVREAAIAFAKIYERCGSGTYSMRAKCAVMAFEYFTGKIV